MSRKNLQLAIAYFTFITLGMGVSILNIAWTYMEETFGVTLDLLGVLLAVSTTGYLFAAFLNGRIIAHIGMGRLLLTGSGLAWVGLLGYTLAPVWGLLLAVAALTSFGKGLLDAGLNTYLSAHHGASAMNWLHACFGIGTTLGPQLVTFAVITLDQSWRLGYATLMGLEVLTVAAFLLTLPYWKLENGNLDALADSSAAAPTASVMETLRTPLVVLGLVLFFLYGGVEIGTGQLANSLLVDGRGVDQTTAGFWISVYWGTFTVGRMLSGAFATRLTLRALLRTSMVVMVIATTLFWLNIGGQTGFFGLALLGFALAPVFPTLTSATPRRVGLRHAPNAIGFQLGVCGLGGALLPGFAAALAVRVGLEVIGLVVTVSALAVFLLFDIMLRREMRRQQLLPAPVSAGPPV